MHLKKKTININTIKDHIVARNITETSISV